MVSLVFKAMVIACLSVSSALGVLNFRSATSTIKVNESTGLQLDQKILDCRGKIVKERDAGIDGQEIIFNLGTLEDAGNSMKIDGSFKTGVTNKIVLNGSKVFRGSGNATLQEIEVSGNNNRLEGEVNLATNLKILDSNSSVTCALTRSLSRDIELNGGTICLEENLSFADDKKITGCGKVVCNGHKLVLGGKELFWNHGIYFDNGNDIEFKATMHLSETWTFSGLDNTIIGNGNILVFEGNGKIVVEQGANLILRNIVLQNVSGDVIKCLDDAGHITFQNVVLVQNGKYSFDKGTFDVLGFMDLTGSQTFVLQPSAPCTIHLASTLYVDRHVTLSVDFVTTRTDLLVFENDQATLQLNNATLHITGTGMHLKAGRLVSKGSSKIVAETVKDPINGRPIEQGLQVGNLTQADDFTVEIAIGSVLSVSSGWFIYKNLLESSWRMINQNSTLQMDKKSIFRLYQPLNLIPGRARLASTSSFLQSGGDYLLGSVEIFKTDA